MPHKNYRAPRGTYDVLPDLQPFWRYVESTLVRAAETFGYRRIDTPVFEDADVFLRAVGSETDIVEKEMYVFQDRGGQEMALRPEGTAAICRAFVEHGMHNQPLPVRLFYYEPMFRYDRPQAGRHRQLQQFGVEVIGDDDAAVDLEVIELAMSAIEQLGLSGVGLVINSIGDQADRPAYLDALRGYFLPYASKLGVDDQRRLETNPLRILDSKDPRVQDLLPQAPQSVDYLGTSAAKHWYRLLAHLDAAGVSYTIDHRLVRGLDYYTRTVFEIQPDVEGAQSTLCAGGRYDGLVEELGGAATPAIGWAAGIDRLVLNLQRQGIEPPALGPISLVMAYNGDLPKLRAVAAARELRSAGVATALAPDRSLRAQLRYASAVGAAYVAIIGEKELTASVVTLRDMRTAKQTEVAINDLARTIQSNG